MRVSEDYVHIPLYMPAANCVWWGVCCKHTAVNVWKAHLCAGQDAMSPLGGGGLSRSLHATQRVTLSQRKVVWCERIQINHSSPRVAHNQVVPPAGWPSAWGPPKLTVLWWGGPSCRCPRENNSPHSGHISVYTAAERHAGWCAPSSRSAGLQRINDTFLSADLIFPKGDATIPNTKICGQFECSLIE